MNVNFDNDCPMVLLIKLPLQGVVCIVCLFTQGVAIGLN